MNTKFSLIGLMTLSLLACSTAKQDKGTIVINNNSSAPITDISVEYTSAKKVVPISDLASHASTTYKIDYADAEDAIVIHYTDAQHNKYTQTAVPYAAKYDKQRYVVGINPDLISDKSKMSTPQTALINNPNSEAKGPVVYITAIDDPLGMNSKAANINELNIKKAAPINSAEAEKLFEAANRANSQIHYVGIEKSGLPASEIAKLKQNFANLNSKGSYSGGRITHEFANTTALKMALVKNGGLARMIAKLNFVPTDIGKVLGEDFKLVGADYSGALNEGKFNSIFRSYDSAEGKRLEINELYLTPDNDYSLEVYKESINFNLQGHLATLQQLKNADKDVYNLDFHVNKRAFSISAEGFSYAEFIDTSVAIAELANQAQN